MYRMHVICLEWWVLVVAASPSGTMIVVQMLVMNLIMAVAKAMEIASVIASNVKNIVK
jgi:hypothetical protein